MAGDQKLREARGGSRTRYHPTLSTISTLCAISEPSILGQGVEYRLGHRTTADVGRADEKSLPYHRPSRICRMAGNLTVLSTAVVLATSEVLEENISHQYDQQEGAHDNYR